MSNLSVIYDPRKIKSIYTFGEGGSRWSVGNRGIVSINAYQESGEMGYSLWFGIYYDGDELRSPSERVNGKFVERVEHMPHAGEF